MGTGHTAGFAMWVWQVWVWCQICQPVPTLHLPQATCRWHIGGHGSCEVFILRTRTLRTKLFWIGRSMSYTDSAMDMSDKGILISHIVCFSQNLCYLSLKNYTLSQAFSDQGELC